MVHMMQCDLKLKREWTSDLKQTKITDPLWLKTRAHYRHIVFSWNVLVWAALASLSAGQQSISVSSNCLLECLQVGSALAARSAHRSKGSKLSLRCATLIFPVCHLIPVGVLLLSSQGVVKASPTSPAKQVRGAGTGKKRKILSHMSVFLWLCAEGKPMKIQLRTQLA